MIQASAADVTKLAMFRAHSLGLDIRLSVHDELVVMCDPADAEASIRKLREAMESVELGVQLTIEPRWSPQSWGSLQPWPPQGTGTPPTA